jgi:hypothetical protein
MNAVEENVRVGSSNPESGATNDFKAVLREMHLRQHQTWLESQAHWRRVSKERLDAGNLDAANFALMISDLAAQYAKEEKAAADKFGEGSAA